MATATKKPVAHYVDNAKFYQALIDYKVLTNAAKEKGLTKKDPGWPRVPEYIGECFVKIAQHLSFKANFINYSFKDEMISDGIENCLVYVDNFDTVNYKNPFAYFTQIIFFAFLRRIEREKNIQRAKYEYIKQLDLTEMVTQSHDNGEFVNEFVAYMQTELDKLDQKKGEPKKRGRKKKVDTTPTVDEIT